MAVSALSWKTRQFVLTNVAPKIFSGMVRASRLAETRMRRAFATQRHVKGSGIEVGAAATPSYVPPAARVRYVDKYGPEALAADPELKGLKITVPDILSSAEKLERVDDDSQDFVLAFSLLEHSQDPLGSIFHFNRVTRHGGSIVVSVPDKRYYQPDQTRELTRFDHFVRDYHEGPEVSIEEHFRETGQVRRGLSGAELDAFVTASIATDAHTHFHVWDAMSFLDFLLRSRAELGLDYEVVEYASYGHEALAVLKVVKQPAR